MIQKEQLYIINNLLLGVPYGSFNEELVKSLNQKYSISFDYWKLNSISAGLDYLVNTFVNENSKTDDFINKLISKQIDSNLFQWIREFLERTIQKFNEDDELDTIIGCSDKEAKQILEKLTNIYNEKNL